MPLVDENELGFVRQSGGFDVPEPKPAPGAAAVLGAAFRRENEGVAAISFLMGQETFPDEPGYNPFEDEELTGSRYIDDFGDRFVGVRSRPAARSMRQRIDKELEDSRLIDAAGGWGTAAAMGANLVSPTTFLPAFAVPRAASFGARVGVSALSAGAGAAIQEGALQAVQVTRSAEESAVAVGLSAVLGGAIGAGTAAYLRSLESRVATDLAGDTAPEMRMQGFGTQGASGGAAVVARSDVRFADPATVSAVPPVTGRGTDGSSFSGALRLRHGYNGAAPTTFIKDYAGGRNYPGSVFGDANRVYLDGDGKWTRGGVDRFHVDGAIEADVVFSKALVVSPETLPGIVSTIGGAPRPSRPRRGAMPIEEWDPILADWERGLLSGEDIAKWAEKSGYDGIIVRGFDISAPRAYPETAEYAGRFGVADDVLQDQVVAFRAENVKAGPSVDPASAFRSVGEQIAASRVAAPSAPTVPVARGALAPAAVEGTQLVDRMGSGALAKYTKWMTPLLRMQTSDASASRAAALQIADPAGARIVANTEAGGAAAAVPGGSVEVRAKTQIDSIMARYVQEIDDVYNAYWRQAGGSDGLAGKIGIAGNAIKKATVGGEGPLSPAEFFELAGRAIRRDGAESADPFVKRAAAIQKRYQDEVFALLPDEIRPDITAGPKFAGGYLPRLFNRRAVAGNAVELEETVFRNMVADQERKSLLQVRAESERAFLEEAEAVERKLAARQETAQERLADVQSRINEVGMASSRALKRVDMAETALAKVDKDIQRLSAEIEKARAQRDYDKDDFKALQKELSAMRRERDAALRDAKKPRASGPTSAADMRQLPEARTLIDYVTGNRGQPKAQTFLQWAKAIGIKPNADVESIFGGKPPRGLIRNDGVELDHLAEAYATRVDMPLERADGQPGWRYDHTTMLDYLDSAARGGREPPDWHAAHPDDVRARLEVYEVAKEIEADMAQRGLDPSNRAHVIAYLRRESPDDLPGSPAGPQLRDGNLDAVTDDMFESIPIDPVEMFRDMDNLTAATAQSVKRSERLIDGLRNKVKAREKVGARGAGREDEAVANASAVGSRLDALLDRAEIYASVDAKLASDLESLARSKADIRGRLEKIVSEWEGDTAKQAKGALKRRAEQEAKRQEAIAAGTYQGKGGRLTGADAEVDKALSGIIKSERNLSDAELRTQAREVVQNLMSSPDGRLPYEWGSSAAKANRSGGAEDVDIPFLKERKFPVPDAELLDVLDNDIRSVMHAYAHSMIPQAEMYRMFGDVRGEVALRAIQDEYGAKIRAATTEKERLALRDQMQADVRDFTGMRDRILGVYAVPDDPDSLFIRGANVARQMNFMSKMGMMVVSSVADAGMIVMRHGLGGTFDALAGALNRFSKDPELARLAKAEKQIFDDAGVGVEYLLGSRAMSLNEIANDYGRGSKFERGLTAATNAYSYLNLSRQWDTATQTVAGTAAIRRIMRNAEAWSKGPLPAGEAEFMTQLNIDRAMGRRIWAATLAGERETVKGVTIPEGRTWADKEAYDAMRFALRQSVDSTVIKPGQDKPLWMSTPTGKVFGQFRSFIVSAQQRILLAGLQQADANMAMGAATMLGLGVLSVALSDLARQGGFKERKPGEWLIEGFDRSGLGGWMMEPNNIAEKVSGQQFGLRPLAGAQPAAKSLNQSKLDIVFGPSVGFAGDVVRMAGAPFRGEIERGDVRALRNQIPGQNLFWARWAFNQMHDSVERSLGVYEPPKRQ